MTPATARMKRAVRECVHRCSGVDGAAATAERSRSTAGSWNNLNEAAFPPLDCALALDEAAMAQGGRPPMTAALARELGGVFVRLPGAEEGSEAGPCDTVDHLLDMMERAGHVVASTRAAIHDGRCDRAEAREGRALLGGLIAAAAAFDRHLAGIEEAGR